MGLRQITTSTSGIGSKINSMDEGFTHGQIKLNTKVTL